MNNHFINEEWAKTLFIILLAGLLWLFAMTASFVFILGIDLSSWSIEARAALIGWIFGPLVFFSLMLVIGRHG